MYYAQIIWVYLGMGILSKVLECEWLFTGIMSFSFIIEYDHEKHQVRRNKCKSIFKFQFLAFKNYFKIIFLGGGQKQKQKINKIK